MTNCSSMGIALKELNSKEEMLHIFDVIQEMYPSLTLEQYSFELDQMLPHNYGQVAAFENNQCIGLTGFWLGYKLWCGKYLELDNVIVSSKHRSKGVGKLIFDYMLEKGKKENVTMLALDSYTSNFKAHKFFYNEGYAPRGFHFINILNKDGVR